MNSIGIDPGISGAIAVLTETGALVEVVDMPIFVVSRKVAGGKTKNKSHINVHELGNILRPYAGAAAAIEKVATRPGEGAVAAFTFGMATGALHGAAGALQMQIEEPRPQDWKKHFKLTADKDQARQLATRRFPDHAALFKRKMDEGRAEACLIALWLHETRATR